VIIRHTREDKRVSKEGIQKRAEGSMSVSKRYEEFAYVLDYLPRGRSGVGRLRYRTEPVVQLLGEKYFTLLEATTEREASLESFERVYVGKDRRNKITHIAGRITYNDLTTIARRDIPNLLGKIIQIQESRFIRFFNEAQALTPRMHTIELVPGIGKHYLRIILSEREKHLFENLEDLKKRTGLPDPIRLITKRILEELSTEQKYYIFSRVR
jgi:putative nucleotide binding protein